MTTVMDKPVATPLAAGRPLLPREHGAWGILLIPFATAAGVAGVFDVKTALLLASVLCFYIARTSYLKRDFLWTFILLAMSTGCTAPLLLVWKLWWLAAFGGVAGLLAFRKTGRSVAMQLLAVGGLTLTAPAAWYAGTGRLGTQALLLWLLNALYFAGGVFYVKMHVAAAVGSVLTRRARLLHGHISPMDATKRVPPNGKSEHHPAVGRKPLESLAEKARLGAAVIAYHLGLVIVLLALAAGGVVTFPVLLAYAPVVVRAFAGIARLSPTLRIRRLGWTEVAYSVVYAIVLIAAFRFG
jgi:hypothetical protein